MQNSLRKSDQFQRYNSIENIYPGLDKMMLPLSLSNSLKKGKSFFVQDRKIITQHKVLDNLINVVEKRGLSKYYAYETMRRLLKLDKYLYSYKHQIIELIYVLSDTNDVRLKNHIDYFCKEINHVKVI